MGKKFKDAFNAAPEWTRILFWAFLGISTLLFIAACCVPPYFQPSRELLAGIGEIMGFASLGMGFEAIFCGFDVKLSKGDVEIEVTQKEQESGEKEE